MMIQTRLLVLLGISGIILAPQAKAQLVATYQFNNTLAADQGGVPALTAINSGSFVSDTVLGQSRTVYQRSGLASPQTAQSGLSLNTTSLGLTSNNYSVEMVFSLTNNPNTYRRIVNSYNPVINSDNGFYVDPGNQLNIYNGGPNAGGATFTTNTYFHVLLSVSPTGESAYLNGALATSLSGATPDAIQANLLTFFIDNAGEYADGRISLLRVYNTALSAGQASTLYNNGNPFSSLVSSAPEPGTLGLLLLGGTLFARRRRNRK